MLLVEGCKCLRIIRKIWPAIWNADGFIARFGGVFEHSPWIAEAALAANSGLLHADVGTLHAAMAAVLRDAGPERQLAVLRAHPDLAGKLALAGELTAEVPPNRREPVWTAARRRSSPDFRN